MNIPTDKRKYAQIMALFYISQLGVEKMFINNRSLLLRWMNKEKNKGTYLMFYPWFVFSVSFLKVKECAPITKYK